MDYSGVGHSIVSPSGEMVKDSELLLTAPDVSHYRDDAAVASDEQRLASAVHVRNESIQISLKLVNGDLYLVFSVGHVGQRACPAVPASRCSLRLA